MRSCFSSKIFTTTAVDENENMTENSHDTERLLFVKKRIGKMVSAEKIIWTIPAIIIFLSILYNESREISNPRVKRSRDIPSWDSDTRDTYECKNCFPAIPNTTPLTIYPSTAGNLHVFAINPPINAAAMIIINSFKNVAGIVLSITSWKGKALRVKGKDI